MSLVLHEKKPGASDGDRADAPAGEANVLPSSSRTSVGEFLNNNGLGDFVEKFREQGFRYAGDVLGLTPRRYKVVGIETLGDTLRLSNVLDLEVGAIE